MTPRIYNYTFAYIYPFYVDKAEKKGKTKAQVDELIEWLTGYDEKKLKKAIDDELTMKEFIEQAPKLNPKRKLITGVVCGIRVENIEDRLTQEMRYIDKLIDELARGKKYENIFRK